MKPKEDVVNWFPEPTEPDETWGREGEGYLSWLLRSTLPRARAAREFLNFNLGVLPRDFADKLRRDLEYRWENAFFELVVARTLQMLGGAIRVEEMTPAGKNPDFLVEFEDGTVVVEATVPKFEEESRAEQRDHSPLKNILESVVPAGWSIFLHELPRIGPADSKKEFKAAAREILEAPLEAQNDEMTERRVTLSSGVLEVSLVRAKEGYPPILGGPGYGTYGDSIPRIRHAVQKKRQQVRGAQRPAILAISASGVTSSFEDFDRALFGDNCLNLGNDQQWFNSEFRATGAFARKSDAPPTYAGVMGFTELGFRCSRDPILWLHPRFSGCLPRRLMALECRELNAMAGIKIKPAELPRALEALGPVRI